MIQVGLVGNPNSGKSSLFNALTGLNQKVGNFPGVTVDKKTGVSQLSDQLSATIIDLPGTYSLYPKRGDEWVTYRVLMEQDPDVKIDVLVLLADAANLKRNLLFVSQIIDLKIPVVVALTMMDLARSKGIEIDTDGLERELGVPVVVVNPRKNKGIPQLKKAMAATALHQYQPPARDFISSKELAGAAVDQVKTLVGNDLSDYKAIHLLINHESFALPDQLQSDIEATEKNNQFNPTKTQAEEILQRYNRIKGIMQQTVVEPDPLQKSLFTEKLDNILIHRVGGYVILLGVLFLLFQSVFLLAQYPMDFIEWGFGAFSTWLTNVLPATWWADMLVNGVVAGIGGIVVFVPQIMILFGLTTILEDTGYMARISFLTDKLMRKVGLNGKSVMPMISAFACAVPAIMSARNIENTKERLLTILVTPLMSCSARLPVYTILIALVIPDKRIAGFISLPGLVMMGLYLFGIIMAMAVSWVAKWFLKTKEKSFFILELPMYRGPRWNNVLTTMVQKAKIFVVDAGRVIMVISMVLWVLSSYGPAAKMEAVDAAFETKLKNFDDEYSAANTATAVLSPEEVAEKRSDIEKEFGSAKLANSYAGILGRSIEPVIRPLGYDWKIGIALITSFAAREVFVGTMATLYSVEDDENNDELLLREKMQQAKRDDGTPVYTLASGVSLMIFYLLAMQCMSTLAIVKRETRSWKWPLIQLAYMTVLAYVMSLLAYQLLS
ncbi:MAG: ferrous iron transport protein B [Flavihumibacter sp.]